MMTTFTPVGALLGGLLIGCAAVLLLWLNGRIAGVSGIAAQAFKAGSGWRIAFLIGLPAGAALAAWLGAPIAPARTGLPIWALVLAGLLVGYGTSMAHGCTSGHGVCGLARLSWRSFAAVLTFLATGFLTVALVRHLL